jgi:hypothetical protein
MFPRMVMPVVAALAAGCLVSFAGPAQAQTAAQQCSAKYQAAKAANELGGKTWFQFRAQCLKDQKAQAEAPAAAANPLRPAAPANVAATAPKPTPAAATAGDTVFPRAIDPKYKSETAAKQRQKTCLDQYNANKAQNHNGGMSWIQKGGGYYSLCNKRLKGA